MCVKDSHECKLNLLKKSYPFFIFFQKPFIYTGQWIHSLDLKSLQYVSKGVIVVSNGEIVAIKNSIDNLSQLQAEFQVKFSILN